MDEPFLIPVTSGGKDYEFEARLHSTSYYYRIEVLVSDVPFSFERDDDGNFRAIAVQPDDSNAKKTSLALLQSISDTLQKILS